MKPPILFTPLVEKLKQHARKLKRELGVPYHVALDLTAQKINCHHWHHVTNWAAITAPTEDAYLNGLLFACDFSEANFEANFFTEDFFAKFLFLQMRIDLEKVGSELNTKNNAFGYYSNLGLEIAEYLDELTYFRFTGKNAPQSVDDALNIISKDFFFPPKFVRFKGKFYDLNGIFLTDQNNNIVGTVIEEI